MWTADSNEVLTIRELFSRACVTSSTKRSSVLPASWTTIPWIHANNSFINKGFAHLSYGDRKQFCFSPAMTFSSLRYSPGDCWGRKKPGWLYSAKKITAAAWFVTRMTKHLELEGTNLNCRVQFCAQRKAWNVEIAEYRLAGRVCHYESFTERPSARGNARQVSRSSNMH